MAISGVSGAFVGSTSWRISWAASAGESVDVYVDGVLVLSTSATECILSLDDSSVVDVVASGAVPAEAYPRRITLAWPGAADVAEYRIEEYFGSTWTWRQTIANDGSPYFTWKTRVLEDETIHQFRIIPYDAAGNAGAAEELSTLMVRIPDVPSVTWSIAEGQHVVTDRALYHLNTNGDDSGPNGKHLIATGSATITASAPKFGAGAASIPSGGLNGWRINDAGLATFSGKFTISCWLRKDGGLGYGNTSIYGSAQMYSGWWVGYAPHSGGTLTLHEGTAGPLLCTTSSGAPSTGVWTHIAMSRDEDDLLKLFVNGVLVGSATVSGTLTGTSGFAAGNVGYGVQASVTNISVDELRIVDGVDLYPTAPFTPPAAEWLGDPYAELTIAAT
jgi:hypothetical protein